MKTIITGWPRTGKTTFARTLGAHVSTDDFIDLGWEPAIEHVAELMRRPGPWVIEGVQAVRALRAFHARDPRASFPAERVYYLRTPRVRLSPGQRTMAKGLDTVWASLAPWLRSNGVKVLGAA